MSAQQLGPASVAERFGDVLEFDQGHKLEVIVESALQSPEGEESVSIMRIELLQSLMSSVFGGGTPSSRILRSASTIAATGLS